METGLVEIATEEVKLRSEEGRDDTNSNLSSRVGSYSVAVILSIAKLFGRGTHDEKLSKGLLVRLIKEMEGEIKIHCERLVGSRGDAGIFGNALSTMIILLDHGNWGCGGFLAVLMDANSNRLYSALKGVLDDHLVFAVLRVMIFLNTAYFRPLHTFSQHPATTQSQMIKVWVKFKVELERAKDYTWTQLRLDTAMLWLDADQTQLLSVASDDRVWKGKEEKTVRSPTILARLGLMSGTGLPLG
jgi:hypothetical protein